MRNSLLCYRLTNKVFYSTSLTASFTEKEIAPGQQYGSFPISSKSGRVDFWFDTTTTAKKDSKKKYIDYPWCAYADRNPELYNSYGYAQDLLAKHWYETGSSAGLKTGTLTATSVCAKDVSHTLQHVYRPDAIALTATETEGYEGKSFVDVYNSKNTMLVAFDKSGTYTIYPGMTLVFHARYDSGLGSDDGGNHACKVTIDGTVVGYRGASYWKVPDNIKAVKVTLAVDDHASPLFSQSWIITVKTTKL